MEDRTQQIKVDYSRPSERLDAYLRNCFPVVSRGTFQRLIEQNHVQVNGLPAKATQSPKAGDIIDVTFPPARPTELVPIDLALTVLFEDADLLVLDKPAGLVVHPASGEETETLVHALLHHCRGSLSGIGGVERPGIVHRLDKDTSGCLVVAKNDQTHVALSDQFKARSVKKLYHAITVGELIHDRGEIRAALARHPSHRTTVVVDENAGREAWTSFRVMERFVGATLVEARIHTGRTHQIRVHFQHIGYPLVGDPLYGKRKAQKLKQETGASVGRQMLHAHSIEFDHPRDQRRLSFKSPWPDDFSNLITRLRDQSGKVD